MAKLLERERLRLSQGTVTPARKVRRKDTWKVWGKLYALLAEMSTAVCRAVAAAIKPDFA